MGEKHAFIDDMFLQGCAFEKCGSLCLPKVNGTEAVYLSHPVIVNYAFACEVYLKVLIYYSGEIIGGHKLADLFEKLPENEKKAVRQKVIMKCGQWNDAFGAPLIEQISDAFVDWRYSYEIDSQKSNNHIANIGFLVAFCETLHEKCCADIPACASVDSQEAML